MKLLADEPVLDVGALWLLRAFSQLGSCRQLFFITVAVGPGEVQVVPRYGRIPITAIFEWADRFVPTFDSEALAELVAVLQMADVEWIERQRLATK